MSDTPDFASMGPRRRRRYLAQQNQNQDHPNAEATESWPKAEPAPVLPPEVPFSGTESFSPVTFTPAFPPVHSPEEASPVDPSDGAVSPDSTAAHFPHTKTVTGPETEGPELLTSPTPAAVRPEMQPGDGSRRDKRSRVRQKKTLRKRTIIILTTVVVLLAIVVAAFVLGINRWLNSKGADYQGSGSGEVMVTIPEGALGSDIGGILQEADVVASSQAFFNACLDQEPACSSIQPGTYKMAKQMSAANALAILVDKANRVDDQITIGPGLTKWQVKEQLMKNAGFSAEDVDAAFQAAPGLPEVAKGEIEGWLAPGTYLVSPGESAKDAVGRMVAANVKRLQGSGIAQSEWEIFLTKASIVQREGSDLQKQDYAKIARVIENRLNTENETVGYLNMDSTVLYGLGEAAKSRKIPTAAEVGDESNPYNTYKHKGLPPSPVGVIGEDAFKGTLQPAKGNWLYFTTVDLNTGETRFGSTAEEQQANVELLKQFCKNNPDICKG